MNKPLARWTIGNVTHDGYDCLSRSIASFLQFYDTDVVVCYNCPINNLQDIVARFRLINQHQFATEDLPVPKGVAWKLYPTRIDAERHEICIDNDIIFQKHIPEIDQFFQCDCTLLLEGSSRTYGRFEKHVPPGRQINSGIYGMPPGFNLDKFVRFYGGHEWEKNALAEHDKNETFDEQGLIAFALLSHPRSITISRDQITDCEKHLVKGLGHHFIGLNRRPFHQPYRLYKYQTKPTYL